ncbi:MAG TPA: cyclase family protein [Aggregatilineales bacterium]|nr:cyclase family protein [Anaerolineales bacterium]HRE49229.1 cyclase family protein [Aggregatilineales bacterium]
MRLVDLSAPISQSPDTTPPFLCTDITYSTHAEGAAQAEAILGIPPIVFRESEGWAAETFTRFGTHDSTHIDAPWHYNSKCQGQPAQTIDQLPLEWFFQDGVLLDMSHKQDADVMTVEDAQSALKRIGYTLKPLDIVLIRCGADAFYGRPDYLFHGCGVSAEATRWLFEQGVRVMGIDAWGWDMPLNVQAQKAMAGGVPTPGVFWAAHQVDLPYAQIERLMNLSELPPFGFKVSCFPLRITGGSAGPARVVAILQD